MPAAIDLHVHENEEQLLGHPRINDEGQFLGRSQAKQ